MLRRKLWSVVHNGLAHPLLEVLPAALGRRFHDWSAAKAWPNPFTEAVSTLTAAQRQSLAALLNASVASLKASSGVR